MRVATRRLPWSQFQYNLFLRNTRTHFSSMKNWQQKLRKLIFCFFQFSTMFVPVHGSWNYFPELFKNQYGVPCSSMVVFIDLIRSCAIKLLVNKIAHSTKTEISQLKLLWNIAGVEDFGDEHSIRWEEHEYRVFSSCLQCLFFRFWCCIKLSHAVQQKFCGIEGILWQGSLKQ